jgi:hypothetical protein
MDLKRLKMSLTDLGENQISMFSDFCHVVKFSLLNICQEYFRHVGMTCTTVQVLQVQS